ncbi:MAG: hypothetical protein ACREOO_06240 [bacterium]
MEASEHFYSDDPAVGHPDVRTTLAGVNYFFLGNGYITAAIQVCTSGQGTPLGLLLMSPEVFGPKRNALSLDLQAGLTATMVQLHVRGEVFVALPSQVSASWQEQGHLPVVRVTWRSASYDICESFYCPDRSTSRLIRTISIKNTSPQTQTIRVQTGILADQIKKDFTLAGSEEQTCFLEYRLAPEGAAPTAVQLRWLEHTAPAPDARKYWQGVATVRSDSPVLNHLYQAARNQLHATIASSGRSDASFWQYNLEWARDQAMLVQGLTYSGQFERARTMLKRMLQELVTAEGDTVDSSRKRPAEEVELDQNGVLLHTMRTYVDWTGDLELAREHWPRIRAIANFPLKPVFRHPEVFLLHNQREFWERHSLFGIEDGMELMYQFYPSLGLNDAAYLARLLGCEQEARVWQASAESIKHAMLFDAKYALVDEGHFIKRRRLDGSIQTEAFLRDAASFPPGIPLRQPGPHYLNPDSSTALPIALEFVDPRGELAQNTLADLEQLWNLRWDMGGYGRYHVTSEQDSPGPWPFAALFIARAYFEAGNDEKVWRVLNWLMAVPGGKAGTWFEFYGPRPIPPCPQVGIIPWTWAEIIALFMHHMLGIRPEWQHLRLRPRLLRGVNRMEGALRLRNMRLKMSMERVERKQQTGLWMDGHHYPFSQDGFTLPWPERDLFIEVKVQ